ncbi:MAG: B12-binding domain-containing radical SAM protein, partial [Anaerolineae bacterium]
MASENLGSRPLRSLPQADFPDVSQVLSDLPTAARPPTAVDVLLVNPPAPDGAIWIRSQHRVGRRSRENMIWPQVSLAQLAAMLHPAYTVDVIDAIPLRMTWEEFEKLLHEKRPKYYVTQVAAPTLTNDLRGVFLARSLGARTIAFGTHVTPMPTQTMESFPSLDFVLCGEPELTLRELIDALEGNPIEDEPLRRLFRAQDDNWKPEPKQNLGEIKGLVWRDEGCRVRLNPDRPFIKDLDDLPLPLHHLLPWKHHRAPNIRGPYSFIVPSRGCPAGCKFCIKHVSYQYSVRARSPENVLAELQLLWDLGLRNVHM